MQATDEGFASRRYQGAVGTGMASRPGSACGYEVLENCNQDFQIQSREQI
jgi:hypothetical protein